jgi:predicted ester cyclase
LWPDRRNLELGRRPRSAPPDRRVTLAGTVASDGPGGGAVASPIAADCPPGTPEENAAIGRRWTEDALDGRDLDLLDEFVAENLVHHAGLFVDEIGREVLKEDLAALIDAFPDVRFTADVVVTSEDRAGVRWTGRGTHQGEFQGLAPTGLPVVFTGINVYRIACGQIVEGWSEPDALGLLRQLGVVPEITPSAATPTG